MKSEPGTYALILKNNSTITAQIGRYGKMNFRPGYYLYVGSAFGPGGVKARVCRHFRRIKRKHWHIDYLREFMEPLCVWHTHDTKRLEHQWANLLGDTAGVFPVPGFGCSDCKCASHLFHTSQTPNVHLFAGLVGCKVEMSSVSKQTKNRARKFHLNPEPNR